MPQTSEQWQNRHADRQFRQGMSIALRERWRRSHARRWLRAGIAEPSLPFLTFGLFFFDYDLDGHQDIFTANGHIDDFIHESDVMITYKERPLLYHNDSGTSRR